MNMSRNPTQALEPSLPDLIPYLCSKLELCTSKRLAISRHKAADPTSRYIFTSSHLFQFENTIFGSATGKCGFPDLPYHFLLQYLRATFSARRVFPPLVVMCCCFDARDGEAPLRARANQSIPLAIFSLTTRFPPPPPERLPGNV